ncbi:MAG: phosphatase PAP2 family protein, partial [bacterium]
WFDGFSLSPDNRCFPSGHSSVAASMLTLIALEYAGVPGMAPLCVVLILITGWSRLNDHAHWPADVVLGLLIGAGVSLLVTQSHFLAI